MTLAQLSLIFQYLIQLSLKCPTLLGATVNIRLMGSPGKLPLMGSLREVINPLYSALSKKL